MGDKQARIDPVPPGGAPADIERTLDALAEGMGGRLNVFATLVHHPELFTRWITFSSQVLMASTLPARDRELLILRTAVLNGCEYEFAHHRVMGAAAGLDAAEIERVKDGPAAPGWTQDDTELLGAVDELHADSTVSDGTWERLARRYDTRQMIDLVFVVGQYTMLSMALNSFGVQIEEGHRGF